MKTCIECGRTLPDNEFYKSDQTKDRKTDLCKTCFDIKKKQGKEVLGLGVDDYDSIQNDLIKVLRKDTRELMNASANGKLNRDDSQSLINYLRFIRDIKKMRGKEEEDLTDEELKKIAEKDKE